MTMMTMTFLKVIKFSFPVCLILYGLDKRTFYLPLTLCDV